MHRVLSSVADLEENCASEARPPSQLQNCVLRFSAVGDLERRHADVSPLSRPDLLAPTRTRLAALAFLSALLLLLRLRLRPTRPDASNQTALSTTSQLSASPGHGVPGRREDVLLDNGEPNIAFSTACRRTIEGEEAEGEGHGNELAQRHYETEIDGAFRDVAASRQKPDSSFGARVQFRRRLVWVLALGLVYYSAHSFRNNRIPFHHAVPPSASKDPTSFVSTPARQVPPYLHYVFGLHPTFGGKPFNLIYYICMTSALETLKPSVLYLHYVYPPSGFYWEEFVRNVQDQGRTKLELRKVRDVTEIYGNPVWHFAHKADVIRLEALKEFGGIYLDVDVLVTRGECLIRSSRSKMSIHSQAVLTIACDLLRFSRP